LNRTLLSITQIYTSIKVFPREVDDTQTALSGEGVAFEQQSEVKSILTTFSLADVLPHESLFCETAGAAVAVLVASRLENDSVKRKKLIETLLKLNGPLNLDSDISESHEKTGVTSNHGGVSSKMTSNIPSSIPASWCTGLGSGVSGREGGNKSQSVQELQALIAQVLRLEAVLRAVDSALEESPMIKDKITKSSYKRPDNPSDAHSMAMAEIQRIDEELRANFGKDLDDLLNHRIGVIHIGQ
jgi:hypothetical protein